jgi:hypothetical protein
VADSKELSLQITFAQSGDFALLIFLFTVVTVVLATALSSILVRRRKKRT